METTEQDPPCPSHLFVELTSLDELSFPATASKRLKFTCVCASPRNLVLGTSSGTVYVFSRFRPKGRGVGSNVPPVDVFTTKDGPVNTISVSPDEQHVAVGSDSGRLSVAALASHGAKTSIVYTTPGDPRKPDKVTAVAWSKCGKNVYAGFASGSLQTHQLTQSVFRSSSKQLANLDSEIVQLDTSRSGQQLLVSTVAASFIFDLENRSTNQVGKKARNSRMGACFVTAPEEGGLEFVAASRPNGRLWEANAVGVVYRTHQFRQSTKIPRFFPVSFRTSFPGAQEDTDASEGLETAVNQDVQLSTLNQLAGDRSTFLVSYHGSRLIVCDVESSTVVLITDLRRDILQMSVCGSDVFVLLSSPTASPSFHKYSFLPLVKSVEKLMLRNSCSQAAEVITQIPGHKWETATLKLVGDGFSTLKKKSKREEALRVELMKMVEQRVAIESTYDNCVSPQYMPPSSTRLLSGVHRVLCQPSTSGVEDDFAFRFSSPLRERSRSSPSVDTKQSMYVSAVTKQNSMPLTTEEVDECSRNGTPDVTRQDILERAKHILESDGRVLGADSLRTLLHLENQIPMDLRFTPTVTVGNAAKALADLALITPKSVTSILTVDRRINASGTRRTGPTIVKPVRRQVARPPVAPAVPAPDPPTEERAVAEETVLKEANSNIIEEETTENTAEFDQNNAELETEWLVARMQQLKLGDTPKCVSVPSTSSDAESVTTTESSKDAKSENEKAMDTEHCHQCGIHRSWLGLALLGSVCRRVAVNKSVSTPDAVPSASSKWAHLLRTCLSPKNESAKLCPRCETIMAGATKTLASLPSSAGLAPLDQRLGAAEIRERIKESGNGRMRIILGCEVEPPPALSPTKTPSAVTNGISGSLDSEEQPSERSLDAILAGVDFRTILFLCCLVLGYRGLLSTIKEDPLLPDLLQPEHWAVLSVLAIRDQQMKKDFVGPAVVREALDSVRMGAFLSVTPPSAENSPSPRTSLSRRTPPPPIYSWIIDANGACLICTLPLQTEVSGSDLEVTTHNCGHTYHSKCVSGKDYCVACRVRARKMAAAASRGVSRAKK